MPTRPVIDLKNLPRRDSPLSAEVLTALLNGILDYTEDLVTTGLTPDLEASFVTVSGITVVTGHKTFADDVTEFGQNYNPDHPTFDNIRTMGAFDGMVLVGRGLGNRGVWRSELLLNNGDATETSVGRSGPKGGDGYGPNGDGTGLIGLPAAETIYFLGIQNVSPADTLSGITRQMYSATHGWSTTEPSRYDTLEVDLAETIPTANAARTIMVSGTLDGLTMFDGEVVPFHDSGQIKTSGRTYSYAARIEVATDEWALLGCVLEATTAGDKIAAHDTGAIGAGANVTQLAVQAAVETQMNMAGKRSNIRVPSWKLYDDGAMSVGERSIAAGSSDAVTTSGGRRRHMGLLEPQNITHHTEGAGSRHVDYLLIGRGNDGSRTAPVPYSVTDAPDVAMDEDHNITIWSQNDNGIKSWDLVVDDGHSWRTEGPIVNQQAASDGKGVVDYGQAPSGVNEIQKLAFGAIDNTEVDQEFSLGYQPGDSSTFESTGAVAYPPLAADIKSSLEGLVSITGTLTVTGSYLTGFLIEFGGAMANTDVKLISADPYGLIGEWNDGHTERKVPRIIKQQIIKGSPATFDPYTVNETADDWVDGTVHTGREAIDDDEVPNLGQVADLIAAGIADGVSGLSVTQNITKDYVIMGDLDVASGDVNYIPGFLIQLASGQTAKLVALEHECHAGTATVKITKNGSDLHTGISVSTTPGAAGPYTDAVTGGDKLAIVLTAASGCKNARFSLELEIITPVS